MAHISKTKTNFSQIPSKLFSGLQNLVIEVNLSRRFSLPLNSKSFLEIYKRATHRAYGYLFCCFTQSCQDEIRYRTNVLPNEYILLLCINFDFIQFCI